MFKGIDEPDALGNPRSGIPMFQTDGEVDILLAADLPQVVERDPHPLHGVVQGDPDIGETPFRIPEAPRELSRPFPEELRFEAPSPDQAEPERLERLQELSAERDGEFGRRRGGRGPEVRGKIGDGEVRLMADRRDDGDPRARERAPHCAARARSGPRRA